LIFFYHREIALCHEGPSTVRSGLSGSIERPVQNRFGLTEVADCFERKAKPVQGLCILHPELRGPPEGIHSAVVPTSLVLRQAEEEGVIRYFRLRLHQSLLFSCQRLLQALRGHGVVPLVEKG
jgi:hypothetical protein